VVVVTLVVDPRSGEIVHGPDLESHGFMDDPGKVFAAATEAIAKDLESAERPLDLEQVQRHVVSGVKRVTRTETGRRPVVIAVVLGV
jgi:mRNA degradation ribonuclease J1/J2